MYSSLNKNDTECSYVGEMEVSAIMDLVIYGAQGIVLGACNAIKEFHPEINVLCFLVTAMENNAHALGGIPVRELNDFAAGMACITLLSLIQCAGRKCRSWHSQRVVSICRLLHILMEYICQILKSLRWYIIRIGN